MTLTVRTQEKRAGVFTLWPVGSINSETYLTLGQSIERIVQSSPTEVVLDMASVDYMSSAGVRVILQAQRDLSNIRGHLILVNLQPQIQKVLDIINALPSLKVFGSIAELDEYLDRMQKTVGKREQ